MLLNGKAGPAGAGKFVLGLVLTHSNKPNVVVTDSGITSESVSATSLAHLEGVLEGCH